jgi:hypothetical protein
MPSRAAPARGGIAVGRGGEEIDPTILTGDTLVPLTAEQLREAERRDSASQQQDAGAAALRKSLGRSAAEVSALPPLDLPAPASLAPTTVSAEAQRALMLRSARTAWTFVTRHSSKRGYVGATDYYPYVTVWDMASSLAATYSARELGLITPQQYRARIEPALKTLLEMRRYDSTAFNKMYSAETGEMVDRATHPSTQGSGCSSGSRSSAPIRPSPRARIRSPGASTCAVSWWMAICAGRISIRPSAARSDGSSRTGSTVKGASATSSTRRRASRCGERAPSRR